MGTVVAMSDLEQALAPLRAKGARVVLTNGVFDLLHVGHVRLLQQCRAYGDALVVGVNADESVRLLKGPTRPYVAADERAELLAALRVVDFVTIFSERTAERLAELVRPQTYVKGADYLQSAGLIDEQRLPEAKVVRAVGGEVVLLPLVPDRSTTSLVERIRRGGGA